MKNSWKRILAVAAILAMALFVLSGCSDNVQAKIDEAVKTAKEAATKEKDEAVAAVQATLDEANAAVETAKAEVTALTEKLTAAEEAAKTAAETAAKEKDEAVAAAKTELEGQVTELTEKLTAAEETAKTAAENAAKELEEAVAAAKAEAEATIKDLQGKLEAVEKEKADLMTKVAELEKQIAGAAEEATEEVVETVEQVEAAAAETPAEEPAATEAPAAAEEPAATEAPAAEEAAVMSHADYAAAELDSAVCVETYVQGTQSWWDNKITVYAQSEDGAYFIYNMACTEEDAAKLTAGAKIRVKGFKSEWAGEVEITDATFELIEGEPFIAEAVDVTDLLGKDDLIAHQNEKVLFKGLTVAAQDDGAAFNYKNAENKTDDLYVRFTKDDVTCNFCVEFYLCNNDTEVYKAVEGLQVGDVVDVEGFLYWYEGANTHITAVTKAE